MLRQVEVSPFCQSFREVCFYFLHWEQTRTNKSLPINKNIYSIIMKNHYVAMITDSAYLSIWSGPVNTMDDINVDIGKSLSKSEKLRKRKVWNVYGLIITTLLGNSDDMQCL